jgi:hypothetical protein
LRLAAKHLRLLDQAFCALGALGVDVGLALIGGCFGDFLGARHANAGDIHVLDQSQLARVPLVASAVLLVDVRDELAARREEGPAEGTDGGTLVCRVTENGEDTSDGLAAAA